MKKTIGYGFKLPGKDLKEMVKIYFNAGGLCSNRKEVLEDIKIVREQGALNKKSKPKVFRVIVEIKE